MKRRKQKCTHVGCKNGRLQRVKYGSVLSYADCPICNGEGVEYIISPKQWKDYQVSIEILEELNVRRNNPADTLRHKLIESGMIPYEEGENRGKISLK